MAATAPHLRLSGILPSGRSFNIVVVPSDFHDLAKLQNVLGAFGLSVARVDSHALPVRPQSGSKMKVDNRTMRQVVQYLKMEDLGVNSAVSLANNPVLIFLVKRIAQELILTDVERKNLGKALGRRLRNMFADCKNIEEIAAKMRLYGLQDIGAGESGFKFTDVQAAAEVLLKMAEQNRIFRQAHVNVPTGGSPSGYEFGV